MAPIDGVRLMGSNLRIMDDAFEYLLPTEAKKKKVQFFTPHHAVEMCVRMLIFDCKPASIRKLRIPTLSDWVMGRIAELATESKLAKRKSDELLKQAKTRVEQLIEEAAQP